MTLHDKLLEVLVCPVCKGPLTPVHWRGEAAEAQSGGEMLLGLDCGACRLRYPIVDDIPVMLVDQAQRIGS